jgi:methylenetetrahydrofolate reductase (NADPH)
VRHISVSGYPEGHTPLEEAVLWSALQPKVTVLQAQRLGGSIITQFGFEADPVPTWIEAVREWGVELPVRIGVPGPAGGRRLASYAARFGVSPSAGIAKKNGLSLTNLMTTPGRTGSFGH